VWQRRRGERFLNSDGRDRDDRAHRSGRRRGICQAREKKSYGVSEVNEMLFERGGEGGKPMSGGNVIWHGGRGVDVFDTQREDGQSSTDGTFDFA